MLRSKKWSLVAAIMVASMMLAACAPQQVQVPVTVVVKETAVVMETSVVTVKETQIVKETEVVEVAKEAYTTPHPILSDIRVRKAIAYCTNKEELVKSVYPWEPDPAKLAMDTFIPKGHWAYTAPSADVAYTYDPAMGAKLLDEAGWTAAEEGAIRTNAAGDSLSIKFTTTTAAFRQTWAAVFEANMAACGIEVLRLHVPASWWFGDTTGLARRDFELGAFAWVGQADPGGVTLWACDQIPSPANGWEGQNYMGWCNEAASKGIKLANNTLVQDERIKNFAIVQEEYVKDVPAIALFNRAEYWATAAGLKGFVALPGEQYMTYNISDWELSDADGNPMDTLVFAMSQEPASLFRLVEDAWVAAVTYSMIVGQGQASGNYTYSSILYEEMPTLESGLAQNNDVEVKAGDKVVDAAGNVVELAKDMVVFDATGAEVTFDGSTPVTMKQLVIKSSFKAGMVWSDGSPVTKEDMALSDKINCDPESGATSFYNCERIVSIEYPDDLSAIYTLVPGYQDPLYFTWVPGVYPANRVIESEGAYKGMTLKEVPAKDWATLPEIAENPLGIGPYVIKEWVKGQQITLEANPNFILGEPKIKTVVIKFFADTNSAVAGLLAGEVDVVASETLGAGAEVQTVIDEAAAGAPIVVHTVASATWEHIDFSLFVK